METFLFLNFLICISFSIIFFSIFFIHYSDKNKRQILNRIFWILLQYLILTILFLSWATGFLEFRNEDFLWIFSILFFIQTFLFLKILNFFSYRKKLTVVLAVYPLASLSLLFYSTRLFPSLLILSSSIFSGFFFIKLAFQNSNFLRFSLIGFLYSLSLFIFSIFFLAGIGDFLVYFSLSSVLVFLLFIDFFCKIESFSFPKELKQKKENKYFYFLSSLLFIVVLVNFIFIGTLVVHEFGHYLLSKFFDCAFQEIVFDGSFFYTEIFCKETSDILWITLGGLIFPYGLALLFYLSNDWFMKDIGTLIFGFNSISLSRDLIQIGLNNTFVFLMFFIGIFFILKGIISFINSKLDLALFN